LYAPLTNASVEQWRMVVFVTGHTLFATSQHDVIPVCKPTFWQSLLTNALTFRDFVPRLELLALFGDLRKSMKMFKMNYFSSFWKSYLVLFLTFITALQFYAARLV